MKEERASVLDWAETIICNAACPTHCTQAEWDTIVHKWLDAKHAQEPLAPQTPAIAQPPLHLSPKPNHKSQ